jgi:23S rRNA pseudouridine1911/1915/1917 synthase
MAGSRADSGIAKMLGISRSHVADLIAAGAVSQNGSPVAKSDRLVADAVLEVVLEEVSREISVQPEDVQELKIIFQDEHIVVIDKPAGVVSHPSQGFVGPSVPGVLMA